MCIRDRDGAVSRYHANIIAENIYSQVDKDGTTVTYLSEIVGHRKDQTAVPKTKGTVRGWNLTKQKTAYEILSGLVGSEMCIRDRLSTR